ncbi:MAG TPA: chromosome segregation protein SMC, partial [Lapillicoccus sp.]|nr:chromosome segregation protein SMC [Lapillicoccus sp.]
LLSDSGIGREMHVIVGQGQLDAVLRATPEERRGFIEEAAGVLKHRKRKERALRKLEAMEANLTRITDLTGEIRRQLGPLGRQAETARKAAVIQAEVRDARLRLIADDLIQLTSTLEQEVADETALIARRTEVEEGLSRLGGRVAELEAAGESARPELSRSQERWYALSRLTERLTSTGSLATERVRLLRQDLTEESGDTGSGASSRDPEELRRQAGELLAQHEALLVEVAEATTALEGAVGERVNVEQAYAAEQQRLARVARAVADRREGLARLAGQVAAKASRIEAAEGEIGRMRETVQAARTRAAQAEREFAALESSIAAEEAGEEDLDAGYEQAASELDRLQAELEELQEAERTAERDRQASVARVEALELSLRRKDGAAALLAAGDDAHTIAGSVASLVQVEAGHEVAVAAALGWAGDALAADTLAGAAAAVGRLRADDAGRAGLLVPETAGAVDRSAWPALRHGARWAVDVVSCPERLRPSVDRLLERVALVDEVADTRPLVADGITAVTRDGDVYGPGWVRGGSAAAPSLIEIQAAVDESRERVAEASGRAERARFAIAALRTRVAEASDVVESALDQLHDSDAKMSAVAEKLGALGVAVRGARGEAERTERAIGAAEAALEADRAEHAGLAERYDAAQIEPDDDDQDVSTDERDRLDAAATAARAHETELRLALRTREERGRALHDRATALEAAAVAEIEARARHEARRQRRMREADVAEAVRVGSAYAVRVVARAADQADALRRRAEEARTARDAELGLLRRDVTTLQEELRELTDSVHRDEVARTQQRLRIEQLETRAVEDLGVDPATLVEEYGPHQLVPQPPAEGNDEPGEPQAYVRETQEKRLRSGERRLAALGRINPLALEEFSALEERHTFLTTQLDDLKRSKRDLLDIIREVDERIERVFTEAYHDVAVQFERVFARLFPGGEGRLILTDPENMLLTGLDVEARPPGKKIKRLSLLSGGERSLVAVALLVAIFTARPSPFYILDEVEAALDDANLGRLILLLEELRDSSQLIVITHQKRTREIADALYGVTMRGDGVTTVVSQRMTDVATPQPA